MKAKVQIDRAAGWIALACGGCITLIILAIMHRDYPLVGHDYAYFIPRILDTYLHMRLNGLLAQWYTPSFGSGLPAFPNPQHLQYSIVQGTSFFLNPWAAVLASTAIISLAGYYFFYRFLTERLELDWKAGTLGAIFFLGNGFYIEHLIAGQLGYQLFPLSAVLLFAITDRQRRPVVNAALIALIIAMMIHQAGFYLIVILFLSMGMTLPLLHIYRPGILACGRLFRTAILAGILCSALAASKVHAAMSFMQHFPREVFDSYDIGLLQAFGGVVAQLLGVMGLGPILVILGHDPGIITGVLVNLSGAPYGIWETDIGLSPVLFLYLTAGAVQSMPSLFHPLKKVDRSRAVGVLILVLAVWVTLEFALTKGIVYGTTKHLPVLRSLHINVRFVAAFIIPLVVVAAFQMHRFLAGDRSTLRFPVSVLLSILALFSYFLLSPPVHQRFFDTGDSNNSYAKIHSGKIFPVTEIAEVDVWQGFSENASSIKPYEPIFGYRLEEFNPEVHPGSVFETDDGYFNMTNPAGFVFPDVNNTRPFERIRVSERDKLEEFVHRRRPGWDMPVTQKVLNVLSLAALITALVVFLLAALEKRSSSA